MICRFSNGKDKVGSNAGPITVSVAGNAPLPLVSGAAAASVSHHHGQVHTIQQVNQHVIHQNIAPNSQFVDSHNNSNNAGVPLIPVVSAAPLTPEKLSSLTFQPNPSLPPATVSVSACPPIRYMDSLFIFIKYHSITISTINQIIIQVHFYSLQCFSSSYELQWGSRILSHTRTTVS